MPEVWIRYRKRIEGGIRVESNGKPFVFRCADSEYSTQNEVIISASGTRLETKGLVKLSAEAVNGLSIGQPIRTMASSIADEIEDRIGRIRRNSTEVLNLIHQESRDINLLGFILLSGKNKKQWSANGKEWNAISGERLQSVSPSERHGALGTELHKDVQRLLDEGETALLSMQHLWEAGRSGGDRFKLIEATTAAELAIKEVLIRIQPTLETLLLEVPSPPLPKLYGIVLKSAIGVEFPDKNKLQKLVERRNDLIHRPKTRKGPLTPKEVSDYLDLVERAIYFLLDLDRKRRRGEIGQEPP